MREEKKEEIRWTQQGKLRIGYTASGRIVIKCPQCSRNIKIDKKEMESRITR